MATANGPKPTAKSQKTMKSLLKKISKSVEEGRYLYAQKTLQTLDRALAVAVSSDELSPDELSQPRRTENIIASPELCSLPCIKDEPFGFLPFSACGDWRMCLDSNDKASLPKELRRVVQWDVLGARASADSPTLNALQAMLALRSRCLPPTEKLRSALDEDAKVINFLLRRANVSFDDACRLIEQRGDFATPSAPFVAHVLEKMGMNRDEPGAARELLRYRHRLIHADASNAATLARFGLVAQVYRCIYEGVVGMVKDAKDPLSIETGFMLQLLFGEVLQRLMPRHMISCVAAKSVSSGLIGSYLRNGFAHEQHVMYCEETFKQVPDSLRKNLPADACEGKYYIVWNVPLQAVEPNWAMFGTAEGVGEMLDDFQGYFLSFVRSLHDGLPLVEAVEKAYGELFAAGVPAGPAESP